MASQVPSYSYDNPQPGTTGYNAPYNPQPNSFPPPNNFSQPPNNNISPPPYQATSPTYQANSPTYQANISPVQPLMGLRPIWGEVPQRHTCQFCNNNIVTEVMYESGTMTWLIAGGLVLIGCWLGCCLIPFGIDGCKDVVHVCPHCHNTVGRKNRLS